MIELVFVKDCEESRIGFLKGERVGDEEEGKPNYYCT